MGANHCSHGDVNSGVPRAHQRVFAASLTVFDVVSFMPDFSGGGDNRDTLLPAVTLGFLLISYHLLHVAWYGVVEVCEGAPVAVSGWVLIDRHDLGSCAANGLHRGTNIIGGTRTLGIA